MEFKRSNCSRVQSPSRASVLKLFMIIVKVKTPKRSRVEMLTLTSIFTAWDSAVLMVNKEKIKGAKRKQKKSDLKARSASTPHFTVFF